MTLGLAGGREARDFLVSTASEGLRAARVDAISTPGGAFVDDREIDAVLERVLTEHDPAVKAAATWALEERRQARAGAPR